MRRTRPLWPALAGLALAAVTATSAIQAQPSFTQVSTPGGLGVSGPTVHDFESFPVGSAPTFVAPGATYSTDGSFLMQFRASDATGSVTPSGSYGLLASAASPVTITFETPVNAFGVWLGNDDTCCTSSPFSYFLHAYGSEGLFASFFVDANMNDAADQFLGFTSNANVTSVVIGQHADQLHLYMDDVTFGTVGAMTATPEPGTITLLATGLAALGVGAMRRRGAAARAG